ncbi:MAG: hypothetical protein ACXWRA_02830, partial [Pseudobdellovibrionaceae bacterium]
KVDRNLASLNINKNGHYFVKVAAVGSTGELASQFSDVASIEYEKKYIPPKPSLPSPQPKLPPDGVSIVSLNGTQDPISFKWESSDADSYQLEIALDEDFQQIAHSVTTQETQIVVTKAFPKGRLYWHLRAQKGSLKSDWSPTFSLEFAK